MRLSCSDLANDQQSLITAWITLFREIRSEKLGLRQGRMRAREICVVVAQFAVLISPRDPSPCQRRLGSRTELAVAASNPPIVDAASRAGYRRYRLPSRTFTKWANFHRGLNHLTSPHFITRGGAESYARFACRNERNPSAPHNLFRLCTLGLVSRKPERLSSCVHPVKERQLLWRTEENSAKPLS